MRRSSCLSSAVHRMETLGYSAWPRGAVAKLNYSHWPRSWRTQTTLERLDDDYDEFNEFLD